METRLTQIEDDLVPVYETDTGERVVYGSELHEVLGVKSRYREWIDRRFSDTDAVENEDFQAAEISAPSGQTRKDHIIKLDTAKEMAMLERNDKGKQVRRYFIEVEKKYRKMNGPSIAQDPMQELSPQLQLLINMELQQKELDAKLSRLEDRTARQDEAIQAVKEAMADARKEKDFSKWVSTSIRKVAESKSYGANPYRYQTAWGESYKRLEAKAGCDLALLQKNARKRASKNGATKTQVNAISKLSVISGDRKLKALYVSTIQEMVMAYCIETVG